MSIAGEEDKMIAVNVDELDHEDYENFTSEFKEIMRTKLTWHHLKAMDIWVFWVDDGDVGDDDNVGGDDYDDDDDDDYAGGIPDPVPEKPMANWRINMKMRSVIRKFFMGIEGGFSLVQFWVPKTVGDRTVLTTADQPFGFSFIDETYCYLRIDSMNLEISVDGKGADHNPGILGHVFQQHITAITPNVKYYTYEEYPLREDALAAGIRSSIACPLIEPSTKRCIGVLEVLSTSDNLPTSAVIRVIEEVGLRSSGIHGHFISPGVDYKEHNEAVTEMRNGVKVVCETHKLPLGQVWFRCKCISCRDVKSGGSCLIPESRYQDYTSYALDDSAKDFLRACSSASLLPTLLKGKGVAGRALASYRPSFCRDVTTFNIAEYPLVHLARVYGLVGSFAICLRSSHTGDADYVLEFFLPPKRNGWDPRPLLCSVLETMKQQFPSFKVASGEELGEELYVEYIDISEKSKRGSAVESAANSARPEFESQGDMMQFELPSPQLMVEEDNAMNDEGNGVGEDKSEIDPTFSEDKANGKTIANENEATEALVAECFGDDSWRKDRLAVDLHREEKSKKRKST